MRNRLEYGALVVRAFLGLLRHDVTHWILGFRGVYRYVGQCRATCGAATKSNVRRICDAVSLAACFYWKPVYCLQRSATTARLLRGNGIPCDLVIGYQPSPFASHAWVEVDGRVVNDSTAYKERMIVLHKW